jgi:hypothetical protein
MDIIQLKFENGVFVPLRQIPLVEEGDVLEFRVPDPNTVYLCETDRLAALDRGNVIWIKADEAGSESLDA